MGDGKYGIHPPNPHADRDGDRRRPRGWASRSPSSSAAATSSAGSPPAPAGWTAPRRTTWACWPRSSTAWPFRTPSRSSASPPGVQTAIEMSQLAEPYIRRRAVRHLEKGRSGDLRGRHRQPLLHHRHRRLAARHGDPRRGDPQGDQGRRSLQRRSQRRTPRPSGSGRVSYLDVLKKNLKVMDSTAISLCMDNDLPIVVFDLHARGNIQRVVLGEEIGTRVGRVKTERAAVTTASAVTAAGGSAWLRTSSRISTGASRKRSATCSASSRRSAPGAPTPRSSRASGSTTTARLTPLSGVGTINVPDARLITIKPWDRSVIPAIEKAINEAGIGINPSNDGETVRLPSPRSPRSAARTSSRWSRTRARSTRSPSATCAATPTRSSSRWRRTRQISVRRRQAAAGKGPEGDRRRDRQGRRDARAQRKGSDGGLKRSRTSVRNQITLQGTPGSLARAPWPSSPPGDRPRIPPRWPREKPSARTDPETGTARIGPPRCVARRCALLRTRP